MSATLKLWRIVWSTSQPLTTFVGRSGNRCDSLVQQACFISKKTYNWPTFNEADIEEEFVRGGGPGGQSVAKTNNCVVIKHKPSGIVIKCHESRSQSENRRLARERLVYQLDVLINKDQSYDAVRRRESSQKQKDREKRNKQRLELKKAFKLREGLSNKVEDK